MPKSIYFMVAPAFAAGLLAAQEQRPDVKGSQDHPLVTRMPGYYIATYDVKEFDAETFYMGPSAKDRYQVEGKVTRIRYSVQPGAAPASVLQIIRNYQNALGALGAKVTYQGEKTLYMKLDRGGRPVSVGLYAPEPRYYYLTVVEEQAMRQEVQASAVSWSKDITDTGHAAVYGIHFDTNQCTIKPESEPALKEIAALLAAQPDLKLHVVGHTDSTGEFTRNMKLSEDRAQAVLQALVAKYKVAPNRLRASGAGPLAPVASNRTEEGKARNRRVELVEQ